MDFEWPVSKTQSVEVAMFADKEKQLFRAARDVVALMSEFLRQFQEYVTHEIEEMLAAKTEPPG